MHGVRIPAAGEAEDLVWVEMPDPAPGEGQIRVRIAAAGVNFIDVYQRSGVYPVTYPFTLGLEGAGVVDQVGPGVGRWKVGDRVAWFNAPASYAELVIVEADKAVLVPDGIDLDTAAAVMLQGVTAEYLVRDLFRLGPDHTCLIHAAAGGVGRLLVQLAVDAGAKVFATAGTTEKQEMARSLGAEGVAGYADFVEVIQEVAGPRPIDVVYDGVGRVTFPDDLRVMRRFGTIALFGQASGAVPPVDLQELNRNGSLFVTRPSIFHYAAARHDLERYSRELFEMIQAGRLNVLVGGRYGMDETGEAHRVLEARESVGKLILTPPEA